MGSKDAMAYLLLSNNSWNFTHLPRLTFLTYHLCYIINIPETIFIMSQAKDKKIFQPIIGFGLSSLLIGSIFSYTTLISYKSSAVIAMSFSVPEFKAMSARVEGVQNFDTYALHVRETRNDQSIFVNARLNHLRNVFVAGRTKWLEPTLRMSKLDAKEFIGEAFKQTDDLSIVGYRISAKADSPEEAQKRTTLLVDYVIDSNLRELLVSNFDKAVVNNRLLAKSTAAEQATQTYDVSMLEKRLEQLKRISMTYPSLNKIEARQVISLEKGGERYMPLPSQMAAIETQILDIRENGVRNTRKLLQSQAEGDMLAAQSKVIYKSSSGRELIAALISDSSERYIGAVEEYDKLTFLTYVNSYSSVKAKYLDLTRFVIEPELPAEPTTSPLKTSFLFGLLGLLIGLIYQLRRKISVLFRSVLNGNHLRFPQAL